MSLLKISILDVGHGDFSYIVTPHDDNLVIDCGYGENISPSSFLNSINNISELQISHPHTDHFADILGISSKIKNLRCPKLEGFKDEIMGNTIRYSSEIKKLRELYNQKSTIGATLKSGNGFSYRVWRPININYSDPNTASLITILSYGSFKILFGGDLPISGWENLLQNENFRKDINGTTIFKVPHHGRTNGCSENLFKHITPMLCIISDKPIDTNNQNTVATNWYSSRTKGCRINNNGLTEQRKVLTTRNDGSIFIQVNENGSSWIYKNTKWRS